MRKNNFGLVCESAVANIWFFQLSTHYGGAGFEKVIAPRLHLPCMRICGVCAGVYLNSAVAWNRQDKQRNTIKPKCLIVVKPHNWERVGRPTPASHRTYGLAVVAIAVSRTWNTMSAHDHISLYLQARNTVTSGEHHRMVICTFLKWKEICILETYRADSTLICHTLLSQRQMESNCNQVDRHSATAHARGIGRGNDRLHAWGAGTEVSVGAPEICALVQISCLNERRDKNLLLPPGVIVIIHIRAFSGWMQLVDWMDPKQRYR